MSLQPRVIYDDLTVWLTHWFYDELTQARADGHHDFTRLRVSDSEWDPNRDGSQQPDAQVIIRDDGANRTSIVTGTAAVGISVLAGTKDRPDPASNLARLVHAIGGDAAGLQPGNPITAVTDSTSPVPVTDPDSNAARYYLTLECQVAGRPL